MVRLLSSPGQAPVRAVATSIFAIATLLALGTPVSAQDAPPERIVPPIRYSLPPGDASETPAPAPSPTATPSPAPAPSRPAPPLVVTPAPPPPPRSTPTPSPSPTASPTPSASPAPSASPRQAPAAQPTAAPVDAGRVEPSAADPAPIELSPTAAAPVEPVPTPSAVADPARDNRGGDWTWWMLAAGLALVSAAAIVAWRRRDAPNMPEDEAAPIALTPPVLAPTPPMRRAAAAAAPQAGDAPAAAGGEPQFLSVPSRPAQPDPLPAAAPKVAPDGTIKAFQNRPRPPATPPGDGGFVTAFRSSAAAAPMLALELQPIRAGCTEDSGYVEYTFAVVNPSDVVVGDLLVSAWLVSANPQQDQQLLDYLAEPADPSRHNVFALRPGEHRELRAAMGVPFDQLHLVEAAGRRFFAPMLLLDARYRTQNGTPGRTSAAYMIGKPHPSSGKLAPVFVDRGPRVVEGLAARPYRLPRSAG